MAIAGLAVGVLGLAVAVNQPFASKDFQWAAFLIGTVGFVSGIVIATTTRSEPLP